MEENEFDNLAMDIAGYIRHRILEVKRDKPVEQQAQIEEAAPKIVDPEATRKEVVKTKKTKTKETP
jgi:putative ubiquitin-RnfH superfamily antitoxin RatB of RatAB toxin-antitoxin module